MRGARGPLHPDDPCVSEFLSPEEGALKGDEAFGGGSGYRLIGTGFSVTLLDRQTSVLAHVPSRVRHR